jgi:hypothetical protein
MKEIRIGVLIGKMLPSKINDGFVESWISLLDNSVLWLLI